MSLPPHTRDLAEYGSVLGRRRLIVVACVLAGVGGGAAALAATPARYTAEAQVQVLPTGVQEQLNIPTARQREQLNLDTESQIARSTVVSSLAAAITKYPDPEELRERVTVDVPPNSAILSISFTALDPRAAAAGAQAFADAYLRNRARAAEDALAAQLKLIAARLRQVEADLDEAPTTSPAAAVPAGGTARTGTARRQAVLARQAADLTLRYDALKTVVVTPGTVISPARPPERPSRPSPPLYLGSGLFLGILAGAGAAFWRDRSDTRIRTCADVERLCGLPVLAELPARFDPAVFDEMAATVATSVGTGPHRLLLEGVGTESAARPLARGLGTALAHVAPVSVVTGRAARPDAALLLVALRRTSSEEIGRAVRQLGRQGARVLGAVTVPPGFTAPVPEPAEWSA